MTSKSYGFHTPHPGSIVLTDYDIQVDAESVLNSSRATTLWSDHSTVEAFFELELDLSDVLDQCSLPNLKDPTPSLLGASVGWKSSRTGLHGASEPQALVDGTNHLSLKIEGALLGGDLRLQLNVVLLENPEPELNSLAPRRYGSWLWGQSLNVQLDGSASMFPVSAFNFKELNFEPQTAMWRIAISDELHTHVSSAVRLKLNTDHPRIKQFLGKPEASENIEFAKFLRAETTTQLLITAMNSDLKQLLLDADYEGTLAEALIQIYESYFPTKSIFSTREDFLSDPGLIFTTVQSVEFLPRKKNL